ncbi:MAG: 2-oxo acid dehydrogenase subunit E2, partial [Planctomycetes bacterium]|nr:2-oxo acid dehydrogenase subunit E2 [Planctomycetota bacterium]
MEKNPNKTIPLTRIQKLIGNLMMQSKRQQPSSFLECRANMTELLMFRKKYCKQTGVRVTTNDFFLCAIARAISRYPKMSAKMDNSGDNIIV